MAKKKEKAAGAGKEKITIPTSKFEVDGKVYQFTRAKFSTKHTGSITAAEALEDAELLAYLVEVKSGVIEEVEAPNEGGE